MPKVSVAMASYNHEPYVGAALRSVLDQSFQDFEIVVTDDASTDRTPQEIQAVGDPRISLKRFSQNLQAVALNTSIKRTTGEYVAILNSDDVFLPGKLEKQVAFLDTHPGVGAVFGYPTFIDAKGSRLPDETTFYESTFRVQHRSRAQWLRHFFFHGNALCHPSVLIRRRCYDALGLYNPALAQLPDLDMWIRLLRRFDIHLMEEPLVGFRILESRQNASAGRPDTVIRLQWEWLQVLKHFLTLDHELLADVFPEIPRQSSASRYPRWLVKFAARVLDRYIGREGMSHSGERGPATTDAASPLPVSWFVGQLAIQVGKPPHVLFGLNTMQKALAEAADPMRYREFTALTGSYDIFDVLSKAPDSIRQQMAIATAARPSPAEPTRPAARTGPSTAERVSIQRGLEQLEARYGDWTYDIPLPFGIWTKGNQRIPHTRLKRIVQAVSDTCGKPLSECRILDLGCSDGIFAIEFAEQGATVVGVEIREANIQRALFCKEVLGLHNLDFRKGDVRNVSADSYGRFDAIICSGILYHLPAADALRLLEATFGMVHRVVIIDTHISLEPKESVTLNGVQYWGTSFREHADDATPQEKAARVWASADNPTSFWFTRPSLINMLSVAGFSSVHECFVPAHLNFGNPGLEHLDRCTFVALKGAIHNLKTSPTANGMRENWPEHSLAYAPAHLTPPEKRQ